MDNISKTESGSLTCTLNSNNTVGDSTTADTIATTTSDVPASASTSNSKTYGKKVFPSSLLASMSSFRQRAIGAGPGLGHGIINIDQERLANRCPMKALNAGVMGFFGGAAMSLFFSTATSGMDASNMSSTKRVLEFYKQMGKNAFASGRNFAAFASILAGTECTMEKIRGRTDKWNSLAAGFVAGAAVAYKGGPKAMVKGGLGAALFSAAIELFVKKG